MSDLVFAMPDDNASNEEDEKCINDRFSDCKPFANPNALHNKANALSGMLQSLKSILFKRLSLLNNNSTKSCTASKSNLLLFDNFRILTLLFLASFENK